MYAAKHAYSYLSNFMPRLQELPIKSVVVCSCASGGEMGPVLCVGPRIPVL